MIAKKRKTARKKTKAKKKKKTAKRKGRVLRDDLVVEQITDVAAEVYETIGALDQPVLILPTRSLSNVSYDKKKGYFEIGKAKVERTLNYNTVKTFAQSLRFMALSKELVEKNDFATKRDAYY